MKTKQIFTIAALALAASAGFAQEGAPLTHAEVKQQVLAARANGALRRAGEPGSEGMTSYRAQLQAPSTLTRAEAKSAVLEARAAHQLAHAGDVSPGEEMAYARAHPSTSTLTRDEVKHEVLEARANGTLIPAGESVSGDAPGQARHSIVRTARTVSGDNAIAFRGK